MILLGVNFVGQMLFLGSDLFIFGFNQVQLRAFFRQWYACIAAQCLEAQGTFFRRFFMDQVVESGKSKFVNEFASGCGYLREVEPMLHEPIGNG